MLVLLRLAGCASAPPPSSAATYGTSLPSAVEVCKPEGERQYLQRLRCANGAAPTFSRQGSGPSRTPAKSAEDARRAFESMYSDKPPVPGEPDYHVVDFYEVRCGDQVTQVVMDMYHCAQPAPAQAVTGFTLAPEP